MVGVSAVLHVTAVPFSFLFFFFYFFWTVFEWRSPCLGVPTPKSEMVAALEGGRPGGLQGCPKVPLFSPRDGSPLRGEPSARPSPSSWPGGGPGWWEWFLQQHQAHHLGNNPSLLLFELILVIVEENPKQARLPSSRKPCCWKSGITPRVKKTSFGFLVERPNSSVNANQRC